MPGKMARSDPRPAFGLPEVLVAVSTSRLSCKRAGKTRTLMPVWDSSGEFSVQGGIDMLRLFVSASIFVIALGLAGLPARAQSSSDATSKSLRVAQNVSPTQLEEQRAAKSVACRKQAKEQKLSGSKRRAFLKDCMRK